MIIQNRDGSIVEDVHNQQPERGRGAHYYAAVPDHLLDEQSSLIERIIHLAFDALGVRHLEVRVYETDDVCS